MGLRKPRVFISFDFDNDQFLRTSLMGQCKHDNSPFDMEDWSVYEPWPEHIRHQKCLEKIKRCDLVIVMVGEKTAYCHGVKAEIKMAKEAGIPVVGVKGYSEKSCPCPAGLDRLYSRTWENIKVLVHGGR